MAKKWHAITISRKNGIKVVRLLAEDYGCLPEVFVQSRATLDDPY